MLKLLAFLISIVHAQDANSYLVLPTPAQAQTRSQQQCQTLGCDGVRTKYWWTVQPLTDSTAAVVILPSGIYGLAANGVGPCAVGCGLTPLEQSAVVTATTLGTRLPWVISEPAFMARFTPIQISAANASQDPAVSVPWTQVKGAATTNLQSTTVINMVDAMVVDGIVTSANALNILKPVAVAVLPP